MVAMTLSTVPLDLSAAFQNLLLYASSRSERAEAANTFHSSSYNMQSNFADAYTQADPPFETSWDYIAQVLRGCHGSSTAMQTRM
jgi:hypothetical protein